MSSVACVNDGVITDFFIGYPFAEGQVKPNNAEDWMRLERNSDKIVAMRKQLEELKKDIAAKERLKENVEQIYSGLISRAEEMEKMTLSVSIGSGSVEFEAKADERSGHMLSKAKKELEQKRRALQSASSPEEYHKLFEELIELTARLNCVKDITEDVLNTQINRDLQSRNIISRLSAEGWKLDKNSINPKLQAGQSFGYNMGNTSFIMMTPSGYPVMIIMSINGELFIDTPINMDDRTRSSIHSSIMDAVRAGGASKAKLVCTNPVSSGHKHSDADVIKKQEDQTVSHQGV